MTNTSHSLLKLAEEGCQLLDRLKLYLSVQDRLWRLSMLLVHPTPFSPFYPSHSHVGKIKCAITCRVSQYSSKETFAIEREKLTKKRCLIWMGLHRWSGKTLSPSLWDFYLFFLELWNNITEDVYIEKDGRKICGDLVCQW